MRVIEQVMDLDMPPAGGSLEALRAGVMGTFLPESPCRSVPVRCVVSRSEGCTWRCEVGTLEMARTIKPPPSIFEFNRRRYENHDRFTVALVVPTGIGAEIGGHAGDATPVARLVASVCDTLVTHPNVVNASDINELPANALYVEGSVLTRLLMGGVALQPVRANRVCLVIDDHPAMEIADLAVNAASAARASMGMDIPWVMKLAPPLSLVGTNTQSGRAVGRVDGLERLCEALEGWTGSYDALALATVVDVPERMHTDYYSAAGDIVNPWGGVEAMLTHAVSLLLGLPTAHAPMVDSKRILDIDLGVVDPRMAAETISTTFLFCVLKGLHRSPRIWPGGVPARGMLTAADVSCLVIPDGCIGLPTLAALEQGIPVIAVRGNRNRMENDLGALPFTPGKLIFADTYLEAAGILTALRSGISPASVCRPLQNTTMLTMEVT